MLSIFRRHAGWGLKVVLGIVIVSFVFFFGYTTLQEQTGDAVALKVGKEEILYAKFRFFYDNQYESFREKFKEGEMPDFILDAIRQTSERQAVQRALTKQFAMRLGFEVSDKELASFIMRNKDFDPVEYKNFLQYFYRENGFSYEELQREDLLLQKFQTWVAKTEPPHTTENDFYPKTGLIEAWFHDFASKAKVKSFVQKESL